MAYFTRPLATAEIEQILCDPRPLGELDRVTPRVPDSWEVRFPGLTSLPTFDGERRRLKFCIATEDIVGPVRNGGIGTTYAYLSEMLAQNGHDTTILYLRGHDVDNGTVEEWIEHYGKKGVKFVPVTNYAARDQVKISGDRWMQASYNMMRWLIDHPMDVVHVSEWRGSSYLSLLRKRQGLDFAKTLFVVKTSSPWMWNRLYGSQSLERTEDLAKVNAERQSVELADMVIGGSLHLLRWMSSQGYRVPRGRTFVQPNVVSFAGLADLIEKRHLAPGTLMPVDEVVFFGRLDARKGLFAFCRAIDRMIRFGRTLPKTITFMGKPGAKLSVRPDQTVLEFVQEASRDWPVEVKILTEFQQHAALEYLLSGNRLAVMPSGIENSSLAVYEAAMCGIPFVASDTGGTPELIAAKDHARVLCDPHPIPLADKIAEAVENGGFVAEPSFDNDVNLAEWVTFHDQLCRGLLEERLAAARQSAHAPAGTPGATICIYDHGDEAMLRATLESIAALETPPEAVIVAVDADASDAVQTVESLCAACGIRATVLESSDNDAGLAFDRAAELATSTELVFLWSGATLDPKALGTAMAVAAASGADVVTWCYRTTDELGGESPLIVPTPGSVSEAFYRNDLGPLPLVVRREAFKALGGFSTDYRQLGAEYEFLSRAQLAGLRCEVVLTGLGTVAALPADWLRQRGYDIPASQFRTIRPHLAALPLALRDWALLSRGQQMGRPAKAKPAKPAGEKAGAGATVTPIKKAPAKPKEPAAVPATAAVSRPIDRLGSELDQLLRYGEQRGIATARPAPRAEKKVAAVPAAAVVGAAVVAKAAGNGAAAKRPVVPPQRPAVAREPEPVAPEPENRVVVLPAPKAEPRKTPPAQQRSVPVPVFDLAASRLGDGSLRGRILAGRRGTLIGYALDESDPSRTLVLEVLERGRVAKRIEADGAAALAPGAPEAVRPHTFLVPAAPVWSSLPLIGSTRVVDIRVEGTDLYIARDLHIAPPRASIKRSQFDGYLDSFGGDVLRGWAWHKAAAETPVDVALFAGETFVARYQASIFRRDLLDHRVGAGNHGFAVDIRALELPPGVALDAVLADNGLALNQSPVAS